MGADFRAFFDDDDRQIGGNLLQTNGGGQARGSGTNDDDVKLHRFTGGQIAFGHDILLHGAIGVRHLFSTFVRLRQSSTTFML